MSRRRLNDGTILNANSRITKAPDNSSKYNNFGIHRVMVTKAKYSDDAKNTNKKNNQYEVVMLDGQHQGTRLTDVEVMDSFGGKDNYSVGVLTPKTEVVKGKDKGEKTPPENTDGSYGYVFFPGGFFNKAVWLGGCAQPNNPNSKTNLSDGVVYRGKFQNLEWLIDSGGNLTVNNGSTSIALTSGGEVNITTSGKTTVNASSDVEINASGGAVKANGSTGVQLTGPSVSLGSAGAGESGVLGDALATILHTHTHGGGPAMDQSISGALSSKIALE